jgi:hypothetical protein
MEVLCVIMGNMLSVDVTAPENEGQRCINCGSTVGQQWVNSA